MTVYERPSSEENEDFRLLLALAADDKGSFEKLYAKHVDVLYRYVRLRVVSSDATEDVTQEVFMTLWKKRRTIVIHGESLAPWLMVTASNHVRNYQRSEWRSARLSAKVAAVLESNVPSSQGAEATYLQQEFSAKLEAIVSNFSPVDRQIFMLCHTEGFSYADAARELELTTAAVRNRLSRTRSSIRKKLLELS